ncbi:MAG: UDPGP type 1 family protein [Clostridia bacterium]|nr:UDPGP type 1 family protein [Clostridia bacterium]
MDLREKLLANGQEHLIKYLTDGDFCARLHEIDWEMLALCKQVEPEKRGEITPIAGLRLPEIAQRRGEFEKLGVEAVQREEVAAVLLAGGQGTRLGSDAPKGAFNIGVTRTLYIFEQQINNLLEVCKLCGAYVPLLIMTSEKNDEETRAFFAEHGYFGYPESYIRFFKQEMAPAVDLNGKLLLEAPARLALSPNGNGGWYSSLISAGIMQDFPSVKWFNVFAVDNVLQRIADPVFIGATIASNKRCGAKVVTKANPEEKVGVLCLEDGLPAVIEYYELTPEMANARDGAGDLCYLYGVILNYLFEAKALEEIASQRIPVHVVKKKVPYLNEEGNFIKPERENGYKFETLILDMVKLAGSCLPFEVAREKEFAPVKNRTGVDSVDTARALLAQNGVIL